MASKRRVRRRKCGNKVQHTKEAAHRAAAAVPSARPGMLDTQALESDAEGKNIPRKPKRQGLARIDLLGVNRRKP